MTSNTTPSPADQAMRQLQSEQSRVLDIIDELRTIGVGALVELPQLIVCGNQSSGKSSVLEAISRVRFPAKSNVCTRFATEVILRRRPSTSIKVSIEPGPSRTREDERQRLRRFTPEAFSNGDDLPALIEKAKECMEITESVNAGFSDDVLKVEISGPDKPELTLVDLPGLYYSTSQDQGRKGISIVRGITERYMKNTRSIILAIITAKADYHLQEVLDMARKFDPQRERTLGIITQPDILEPSSEEEDTWLQFLENDKVSLQLGWHVLRNRSFETRDASDDARDEKEAAFFEQGRWASIPRENVGIDSLRRRLSSILFKHIRRNLPELITDIQKKIEIRQSRLTTLGEARSTLQQQRGFLLAISTGFEKVTGQALNGMYSDRFFEDGPEYILMDQDYRRLRAMIRELNECFAEAMNIRGKRRTIIHSWNQILSSSDIAALSAKPYMKDWEYSCVSRETLELEINSQARRKRGIELPGSANQLLVGDLFRDQARPWEDIAREHMMNAWSVVRYFIHSVLQYLTTEHTYSLIATSLIDPELDTLKESLLAKLTELTAYTKRGHPLPVGKSFLSKIRRSRVDRQFKALEQRLLMSKNASADASFTLNDFKQATKVTETEGNEFAASEIIDQMQAYYDTAIVTFVDNIAILGIENCLLAPLETIFTAQTINNLSSEKIQDLASEPSSIEQERKRLSDELRKLQEGLSTLRLFSTQMPRLSKPMVFTQGHLSNARASVPIRSAKEGKDSKTDSSFFSMQPSAGPNTGASHDLEQAKQNISNFFRSSATSKQTKDPSSSSLFYIGSPPRSSVSDSATSSISTPNKSPFPGFPETVPTSNNSSAINTLFSAGTTSTAPDRSTSNPLVTKSGTSLFGPLPTGFGTLGSTSTSAATPNRSTSKSPSTKPGTSLFGPPPAGFGTLGSTSTSAATPGRSTSKSPSIKPGTSLFGPPPSELGFNSGTTSADSTQRSTFKTPRTEGYFG